MSVGLLLLKTAAVAAAISFQSQPVAQLGAQASGSALHRCFESTKPHGQGRVPLRIAANSRPTQRIRKTQRSRSY